MDTCLPGGGPWGRNRTAEMSPGDRGVRTPRQKERTRGTRSEVVPREGVAPPFSILPRRPTPAQARLSPTRGMTDGRALRAARRWLI